MNHEERATIFNHPTRSRKGRARVDQSPNSLTSFLRVQRTVRFSSRAVGPLHRTPFVEERHPVLAHLQQCGQPEPKTPYQQPP